MLRLLASCLHGNRDCSLHPSKSVSDSALGQRPCRIAHLLVDGCPLLEMTVDFSLCLGCARSESLGTYRGGVVLPGLDRYAIQLCCHAAACDCRSGVSGITLLRVCACGQRHWIS